MPLQKGGDVLLGSAISIGICCNLCWDLLQICWDLQFLFRASHDLGKSKGTEMAPGSLSWVTKTLLPSERQRQHSPGGEGATEQRWGLTRGGGEMPQVQSQVTGWLPGGVPASVTRGRCSE